MCRNAAYRVRFHMSSDCTYPTILWQTASLQIKHQAISINFVTKWRIISLVNQNSRGPTKNKSNHCLCTGNENVLLARLISEQLSKTFKEQRPSAKMNWFL